MAEYETGTLPGDGAYDPHKDCRSIGTWVDSSRYSYIRQTIECRNAMSLELHDPRLRVHMPVAFVKQLLSDRSDGCRVPPK